jgi:hypothetical protein
VTESVFAKFRPKVYPYIYDGSLFVGRHVGGTPSDPKVAESYIRTKLDDADDIIQQAVSEIMLERGLTKTEAAAELALRKHLNGYKRDPERGLYAEGRTLKACLKEAAGILIQTHWPKKTWGNHSSKKGTKGFMPEHIFVLEDRLYFGVNEPTGVQQRFIATHRGTGIQMEEYIDDAKIDFTVGCDYLFSEEDWGFLWSTAEQNGWGASRSQDYGKFAVTRWDPRF